MHRCRSLGWPGHGDTRWPCPGLQSGGWPCTFDELHGCIRCAPCVRRLPSGELVKLRGAQQARQGCRTAACDAPAEPLQWQASFRRVQHGQAGGVRCRRQRPVQLVDARTVETCCKLTVRAATHTGEGGRTHRDDQRSNQPSWHNLLTMVPMRRCWAWVRDCLLYTSPSPRDS